MTARQGSAKCRHDVFDAGLEEANQIEIALDDEHPALGSDRLFGKMEAIQQRPFLVDGGFGRVEVLRGLGQIL